MRDERQSRYKNHFSSCLITLGIFLLALAPRALNDGTFLTIDEAYHWFDRSSRFLKAVRDHTYADTLLVGHPGVTTMWLGATGIRLHQLLSDAGIASITDAHVHRILVRLPVAITTALCIALAYPVLLRIVGATCALVAALLWATEPFLIAHSQLLHTDALLTSFITLAIMTAFLAFDSTSDHAEPQRIRWGMVIVSGGATGLALLTKSPAIILIGFVPLIALVSGWRATHKARRFPLLPLVAWGSIAVLVCFIVWPALWVEPIATLVAVANQAQAEGGTPHDRGNFFWGHTVSDPGPFFYPVALALRMTPWTLVLFAVGIVVVFRRGFSRTNSAPILTIVYIVMFLIMLSTLPKKFDRYALPVFPAIMLVAAVGFVATATWIGRSIATRVQSQVRFVTGIVIAGLLIGNLIIYHPYELAYYNPVLGGGSIAAQTVPVGWGEGYDQAGAFISTHSTCADPVAVRFDPVITPFMCNETVPLDSISQPDAARYAVLTIDQLQRGLDAEASRQIQATFPLVHTVQIHGIDYAHIYEVEPQVKHEIDATFGSDLRLRRYDIDDTSIRGTGHLTVTLQWTAERQAFPSEMLFIHVLKRDGTIIGQIDVPLAGPRPDDWTTRQTATLRQIVPVQVLPQAETYWVALGVYQPGDGLRLRMDATPPPQAPSDGPNVLILPPVEIP